MSGELKACFHCGGNIEIRNPKRYCDHLYYPDSCKICKEISDLKAELSNAEAGRTNLKEQKLKLVREVAEITEGSNGWRKSYANSLDRFIILRDERDKLKAELAKRLTVDEGMIKNVIKDYMKKVYSYYSDVDMEKVAVGLTSAIAEALRK